MTHKRNKNLLRSTGKLTNKNHSFWVENNIPGIKIKDRNTYLSEFIWQKLEKKHNLRRVYIQRKD